MTKILPKACIVLALVLAPSGATSAADSPDGTLPPFQELYDLVRSNLTSVTESELNRALVMGFVNQLRPQVMWSTNSGGPSDYAGVPLLSKTTVLEGAFAFLRIGRVGANLPKEVRGAYEQLRATNQLKGLIVDLRYAVGQEYLAAAETADLFFTTEQPLLQWGDVTARSTTKARAIESPLVILINRDTSGAAEALAAALRQADGALLIGSPSAGRAYVFKELSLSTGQKLRIASGRVATGNGEKLADTGLPPDIRIAVDPQDEKTYFEDPYKAMPKPYAQAAKLGPGDAATTQTNARPRRPRNEAELVRMQREGFDFESELPPASFTQVTSPVVADPAVSRALDILKGLSLAGKRR